MTTMLEKATAAVSEAMAFCELPRADAETLARAALLAIREPDWSVQAAGIRDAGNPKTGWVAMIDAILNEKPEGGE